MVVQAIAENQLKTNGRYFCINQRFSVSRLLMVFLKNRQISDRSAFKVFRLITTNSIRWSGLSALITAMIGFRVTVFILK
jgi:hypothetical protein